MSKMSVDLMRDIEKDTVEMCIRDSFYLFLFLLCRAFCFYFRLDLLFHLFRVCLLYTSRCV